MDELTTFYAMWMFICSITPFLLFALLILYSTEMWVHQDRTLKNRIALGIEFRQVCRWILAADVDRWNHFVARLSNSDRRSLINAKDAIVGELLQLQPSRLLHQQRLIMSAKNFGVANFQDSQTFATESKWFWGSSMFSKPAFQERAQAYRREKFSSSAAKAVLFNKTMGIEEFSEIFKDIENADSAFRAADTRNVGVIRLAEFFAFVDGAADAGRRHQSLQQSLQMGDADRGPDTCPEDLFKELTSRSRLSINAADLSDSKQVQQFAHDSSLPWTPLGIREVLHSLGRQEGCLQEAEQVLQQIKQGRRSITELDETQGDNLRAPPASLTRKPQKDPRYWTSV